MNIKRFIKIQISKLFRKNENRFDHIISLGYNCEVTFRFLKYFDFEETSLFNWTYCRSIKDLINALDNFQLIGNGDFEYPNPLFECKNTHIRFHGKAGMDMYLNKTATEEQLKQDKEDLIERIEHFKDKFSEVLKSSNSKLYIYKIQSKDVNDEIKTKVKELYEVLATLGGNNFKLLIVGESCEKLEKLKNSATEKIIFRTVKYYANDDTVTDKKFFNNGWDNIYAEFWQKMPNNYKKKKKYKFEK